MADAIKVELPAVVADVAASTNCFYLMSGFADQGIMGENVLLSNPYLVDNYYLDSYSPCVDGAEPIAGVNDAYAGAGPDMGAKEGGGPRGELVWKTPGVLIDTNMNWGGVARLIDNNLDTGNYWGGGYMVFDISDDEGNPVPVYGIRFYTGAYQTKWNAYVSDSPCGPWQVLTRWFGWDVAEPGIGAGVWDQYPVDFFLTGKYIKLSKWYGPIGADSLRELDIQTREASFNPNLLVVDNGAAAFATTWTQYNGGYGGNFRQHAAGAGEATATWRPNMQTPGTYDVYVRWTSYADRATNAPYTINYDGGSESVQIDQQINGNQWTYLGAYPFAQGTTGNVALSNDADGVVAADAVMFILQ